MPFAGLRREPFGRFLAFDLAGALLWSGMWIVLGGLLGRRVTEEIVARLDSVCSGALWLLGGATLAVIAFRLVRRLRRGPARIAGVDAASSTADDDATAALQEGLP